MSTSKSTLFATFLLLALVPGISLGVPPIIVQQYVVYDDEAEEVTFTILYDQDPTPFYYNAPFIGGNSELEWQYYIFTDGIIGSSIGSERIVNNRWLDGCGPSQYCDPGQQDEVLVQDTLPFGLGSGGWGAHRGWVDFEVTPDGEHFAATASVSYSLLGDDGRFAYELLHVNYGATYTTHFGLSLASAPPPPPPPGPPPVDVQIDDLLLQIFELGLNAGNTNSLVSKIENAEARIEDGNIVAAINVLGAFINAVEAHRGKLLTETEADDLIAAAELLIDTLLEESP